jgi:hypothetical protein
MQRRYGVCLPTDDCMTPTSRLTERCAALKFVAAPKWIPNRANIPNPYAAVAAIVSGDGGGGGEGSPRSMQAGTALDLQKGLFINATAASGGGGGQIQRVTTTVYAHRAVRNLLVYEVSAEFGAAAEVVTVELSRCGGGSIDWINLEDFKVSLLASSFNPDTNMTEQLESGAARSLVVKYMEENCELSPERSALVQKNSQIVANRPMCQVIRGISAPRTSPIRGAEPAGTLAAATIPPCPPARTRRWGWPMSRCLRRSLSRPRSHSAASSRHSTPHWSPRSAHRVPPLAPRRRLWPSTQALARGALA